MHKLIIQNFILTNTKLNASEQANTETKQYN